MEKDDERIGACVFAVTGWQVERVDNVIARNGALVGQVLLIGAFVGFGWGKARRERKRHHCHGKNKPEFHHRIGNFTSERRDVDDTP